MRDYEDRPLLVLDGVETSEMLEGIEAIVLSIADRVDRIASLVETVIEHMHQPDHMGAKA